jgi:ferrous iron transport protein B
MAKESSWRWALFSTCFNTALGFAIAVLVYQIGSALA